MKKYTITVNGTAYEVEVEEAGVVASAPKAAAAPAPKAAAPVLLLRKLLLLRLRKLLLRLLLVQPPFPLRCLVKFWKLKLKLATLLNPATF